MPYTYMNPPVVEAACEFRFDASSSWDLAIPGQVYTDLREQFPDKEQAQTIEATLGVGNEGFQQAISRQELLKMESHDKTEVVQVAAHRLVVSKLRPYSSWGEFRPLIMRAFRSYLGVAQPAGLYRMGLRYINRLNLPQEPAQLEDYLEYYPFTGPELPSMMDSFLVGATFPFGERSSRSGRAVIGSSRPGLLAAGAGSRRN